MNKVFQNMLRSKTNKQLKGKAFICTINNCGNKFSNQYTLKRHFVTIHCGVKKFMCNYCNRKFAQKQNLDEHIFTHTANQPYMCDVKDCGVKFRFRSSLCHHRKNIHGLENNKNRKKAALK